MFASERRKKICQMLMDYKSVDVSRLSKLFNISTVTIRKDLELLESEGILTRTHGGAILNDSFPQQEHTPDAVEDMCNPEESLIATIASHFIQDDEFIFLGTGSICTQISRILPEKKNLTIVTNNISAAIHLKKNPELNVIIASGTFGVYNGYYGVMDAFYTGFLNNMYFDKVFIAVDGISLNTGYSVDNSNLCLTYQNVCAKTGEVIVCAESSKFSRNSFARIGAPDLATKIITAEAIPEEYSDYFYSHNIPVYHSYRLDDIQAD